ncbi:hypothetical protein N5B55_04810 [Ralstonia pickettii]|uniref:hypothetical protein n=1 Tax=Ralstonia pickettii TaxID=329 RepID=UPI002714ADE0|nr:hypothetical protein [Ralstonia pickettii]WKZ86274.1 hypothetical protein N5B55_04810 [Ralstonia pickettii]
MLKAFGKKSVDSVLAAFNQTITDLELVGQESLAQAERADQDRIEAEARRNAAMTEASRAHAVAERLKNLVVSDAAGGVGLGFGLAAAD